MKSITDQDDPLVQLVEDLCKLSEENTLTYNEAFDALISAAGVMLALYFAGNLQEKCNKTSIHLFECAMLARRINCDS